MTMELLQFHPEQTVWPRDVPLLVLHGDADIAVPHADAVEYCERNAGTATMLTVRGAGHGFGADAAEVYEATVQWFRKQA